MSASDRAVMDISAQAQAEWATTDRGKIICPECQRTGYRTGTGMPVERTWVWAHRHHDKAPCGKIITIKGMRQHISRCETCQGAVA